MPSWTSAHGRAAGAVGFRRSSVPTGKMVRPCTCHVIGKAFQGMTTGEPKCHQKSGDQRMASFNTWRSSMNFSIAKITRRLLAPRHELSCSWFLWCRLLKCLRERGCGRSRESGAFLLGHRNTDQARVVDFVLYDDLDSRCLDTGIVRFDGRYFGTLWALCRRRNLTVVADIHVHPGSSQQSTSDRDHPMISSDGHLALILPRFATGYIPRRDIGIYRYRGDKRWRTVPPSDRRAFFHIGI